MAIFAGASMGAIVKLCCPKCGEVQARARAAEGTEYACRACGHTFRREDESTEVAPPKKGPRQR